MLWKYDEIYIPHNNIMVVASLLFGCCQASLAQSRDATLPHSMKGYELYSWKSRGEWLFSLLIGTNRLKTFREVSSRKIRVPGVRAARVFRGV